MLTDAVFRRYERKPKSLKGSRVYGTAFYAFLAKPTANKKFALYARLSAVDRPKGLKGSRAYGTAFYAFLTQEAISPRCR
jgi:hypothetical protein